MDEDRLISKISTHFLSLSHSIALWDPEALASCALMVEVTMATRCSCGPRCRHTHKHAHPLFMLSLGLPPSLHAYIFGATGAPKVYHPSWFWLTDSRGSGSQLVMVLISHNALQPLGTHCARSQLINIHEPSDEYADWETRRCPGEQQQPTNQRPPCVLDFHGSETSQETGSRCIRSDSSELWFRWMD